MGLYYNDFSSFMRRRFGCKVQKISLDGGFTCPNRDGTVGRGGCTYCNNQTFNPAYCHTHKSVKEQLTDGVQFFAHKYPEMRYLAYFQAYTNTYAPLDRLRALYEEALQVPGVVGIVISTRPDCISPALLDYLATLAQRTYVLVEYGIESTDDATLARINRGHTYAVAVDAVTRTAQRGIDTGAHLIVGLPGEKEDAIITMAHEISRLPLTTVKLHQLQLIKDTRMAQEYEEHPEDFKLFSPDEYINLVAHFVEHIHPQFVLERFVSSSPDDLLIAPRWGLKNYEFVERLNHTLQLRGTRQGIYFVS